MFVKSEKRKSIKCNNYLKALLLKLSSLYKQNAIEFYCLNNFLNKVRL